MKEQKQKKAGKSRVMEFLVLALLILGALVVGVAYFGKSLVDRAYVSGTAVCGCDRMPMEVSKCANQSRSDCCESSSKSKFSAGAPFPERADEGRLSLERLRAPERAPFAVPAPSFNREEYGHFVENEFLRAQDAPLSTFSIDVDTASYANMRRFLNERRLPPPDSIRAEEFVNYFSYEYPAPTGKMPFAVTCELAPCPWTKDHELLRIGLQAKKLDMAKLPPNNLVFLIDVSGSMCSEDKLPLLKSAMKLMTAQLRDFDQVAIVVYASETGIVLPSTPGSKRQRIVDAIENLRAGGSTSGGAGIVLAYEQATKSFLKGGNNRVILATDGDFNVGVSSEGELVRLIEEKRESGIFLTVLGFGTGNYQDAKMKKLADNGNGNYAYIDSLLEAKKVLMTELGSTLFTVAKDVKIQIEFNPAQVESYRLVGYESRLLKAQDFNNDKKDAGEMGAGHRVTAFYELVPSGKASVAASVDPLKYQKKVAVESADILTLKLRYKLPDAKKSTLVEQPLTRDQLVLKAPSREFQFGTAAAEFALILRDSQFKGTATLEDVVHRAKASKGNDDEGYRAEFIRLAEMAQLIKADHR